MLNEKIYSRALFHTAQQVLDDSSVSIDSPQHSLGHFHNLNAYPVEYPNTIVKNTNEFMDMIASIKRNPRATCTKNRNISISLMMTMGRPLGLGWMMSGLAFNFN